MKFHYILFSLMMLVMLSSVSAFTLQINATGDQGIGIGRDGGGAMIQSGQTFFLNGNYQYDPQIIQMHINGLATVDHCYVQIFNTNLLGFPTGDQLMNSFNLTCNVFNHVSFIIDNTTRTQSLLTNTLYAVVINSTATINPGQLSYFTYQQSLAYNGAQIIKYSPLGWAIGDVGYDFNLTMIGNTSNIPPPPPTDKPLAFYITQPPANSAYNNSMLISWTNATNITPVTYQVRQHFTSNNSLVRTITTTTSLTNLFVINESQSQNYTIRINASNGVDSYIANSSTVVIDQVSPVCIVSSPITGDGLVSYTINATDEYQLKNYAYTCTIGGSGSGGLGFNSFVQHNNTMTITSNRTCTYTIRDWYSNTTCTQVFIWNGTIPIVNMSNTSNLSDVYSFITPYCAINQQVLFDYKLIILGALFVGLLYFYYLTRQFFVLIPLYLVALYIAVGLYYCDSVISFLLIITTIVITIILNATKRRR